MDRFANGDTQNDVLVDTTDLQAFHGGDLEGVKQHLDHIQSLGLMHLPLSHLPNENREVSRTRSAY